jgi:outer membrane protein OmpA-like peptidoglycan-associated protein
MKQFVNLYIMIFLFIGCGQPENTQHKKSKTIENKKSKVIENKKAKAIENIKDKLNRAKINFKKVNTNNNDKLLSVDTSKYIYFKSGKYNVTNKHKLLELLKEFKNNKELFIYIVGHTDSIGDDENNQLLSELRAREVYKELLKLGISKNNLDYIGYGEEQLITTNKTVKGRAKNRRVELYLSTNAKISHQYIKKRSINIKYLNNHNKINAGKVKLSIKGLTKNKSAPELLKLEAKVTTPRRKQFNTTLPTRKHFIYMK